MRISLRVIAFIMLCMVLLIFSSWHYLEDEPPLLYDDSSRRKGQRTSALVGHSPSFYFKPFLDLNNTELGDSDSKCSEKYGVGLIQGWKAQKKLVCVPDETTALQTSMDCFYHKDQATENLCEVRKFALDVAKIKSIESLDQDDAQVWGGSMVGQCTLDSNEFQESRFGNAAQKRLLHAFVTTKSEIQCDKWYEKPVFVLSRWDATNLYHAHEDFIQTFSAYLVAGLDVKDTLIVLADAMKLGPFFDFWDHVMSNMNGPLTDEDKSMREHRPHVMRLNEFLDSVTRNLTTQAQHVCLRRAVFGVHAGVSPMSREIGHKANCKPPTSALFVSFRIFVLERLGFESDKVAIAKQVKDKSPIKVTYITRKGHLRHIQNEDVLLKQITTAVCSSYGKFCF